MQHWEIIVCFTPGRHVRTGTLFPFLQQTAFYYGCVGKQVRVHFQTSSMSLYFEYLSFPHLFVPKCLIEVLINFFLGGRFHWPKAAELLMQTTAFSYCILPAVVSRHSYQMCVFVGTSVSEWWLVLKGCLVINNTW